MPAFDLLTIGHSNLPAERFVAMLQNAGVGVVADVRSVPASRHCPWFAKANLAARLAQADIGYRAMGDTLGGRPREKHLYRDGIADYEAMAMRSEFRVGLDRLEEAAPRSLEHFPEKWTPVFRQKMRQSKNSRALSDSVEAESALVCLMCAEREPLDCHRCLLVARALAERGFTVGHILHDGTVEPHAATERRLLALDAEAEACDLFAAGQDGRLAAAYRCRSRAIAFRQKGFRQKPDNRAAGKR